jgi:hypothetical protein
MILDGKGYEDFFKREKAERGVGILLELRQHKKIKKMAGYAIVSFS